MKKVLITGTTGMLGADLVQYFSSIPEYEVYGLGRSSSAHLPSNKQIVVDLYTPSSIKSLDFEPDVIIHTAAITDLAFCEQNPGIANQVHVQSSRALACLGDKRTHFFYISTDSVFDGQKGWYNENAATNPLNVYAKSKLEGEVAVQKTAQGRVTIVRTNIYGFGDPMKNSLTEWAYKEWFQGKDIAGFTDIVFNALFTGQLSTILEKLISKDVAHPIINIASSTSFNKFEFLDKFRELLKVSPGLIRAALSTQFPSKIKRPQNTSLDTTLLSTIFPVPTVDDGLENWCKKLAKVTSSRKHTFG